MSQALIDAIKESMAKNKAWFDNAKKDSIYLNLTPERQVALGKAQTQTVKEFKASFGTTRSPILNQLRATNLNLFALGQQSETRAQENLRLSQALDEERKIREQGKKEIYESLATQKDWISEINQRLSGQAVDLGKATAANTSFISNIAGVLGVGTGVALAAIAIFIFLVVKK